MKVVDWAPLATRGYVVVSGFLSSDELDALRRDYGRARRADVSAYTALEPVAASVAPVARKVAAALPSIRAQTGFLTDRVIEQGVLFSTEHMNLGWHLDYKSYYLFQDHRHHLSFWMPISKPVATKSGLSLVPMDRLKERAPSVHRVVEGRGTARYEAGALHFEDGAVERELPCPDLNELAVSPELEAGDLLVFRSDVLHRTQDVETPRVALSLRALHGSDRLAVRNLLRASPGKRRRMLGEPNAFCEALATFMLHRRSRVTAGELIDARRRFAEKELVPRLAFAGARLLLPALLAANGLRRAPERPPKSV